MAAPSDMRSNAARLQSFQQPQQLAKRRASSQSSRKKNGNTVEWPHEQPDPDTLAKAGFFYKPTQDSLDNVQCFLCHVKLDGWEATDDPLHEHISHAPTCAWALSLSVCRRYRQDDETRDPMSDEMLAARRGTFEVGDGWEHESKRGWKCKVNRMVEAGWTMDLGPDGEDGATCWYCELSLDGWEPKDDPFEEHKRRAPDCAFFRLCEEYHGSSGKGKGKTGKARGSTASKGSRLSVQSAVSGFSDATDLGAESVAGDDSIMSTASQATVKGGKKKGRPAKGAGKGRKRANTVDENTQPEVEYPDLTQSQQNGMATEPAESSTVLPVEESLPSAKATKKSTRQAKQTDSSVIEISQIDAPAPKKATRGRKPKVQPPPEPEAEPEAEHRLSDVSAQLQEELERSMDQDLPEHESTPQPAPPKRGKKRTSDGIIKKEPDSSVLGIEFPVPPAAKGAAANKGKGGRKPSKQVAAPIISETEPQPEAEVVEEDAGEKGASIVEFPWMQEAEAAVPSEPEPEPEKAKKGGKGKKSAPATKKGKGKKASSSARSSKATVITADERVQDELYEDLARDEAEIEAELARIAAEETARTAAITVEQEQTVEFEPSPSASHKEQHAQKIRALEKELQAEVDAIPMPSEGMANLMATVAEEPLPASPRKHAASPSKHAATPSPSGSDKENMPSSVIQQGQATAMKVSAPAPIFLSPTKTTRIPLAPGTPNRNLLSPSKAQLSPSKSFAKLTSTQPWLPADLDNLLLASPQASPDTLGQRLASAGGVLTEKEKGMSVEEWVRWRAERGEEELRRRCEELVGVFEREGVRGASVLSGIVVG